MPQMVILENLRLDWDPEETGYSDLQCPLPLSYPSPLHMLAVFRTFVLVIVDHETHVCMSNVFGYIQDDLKSMGYWVIAREFDASEHGSYPDRCRWYIQAVLGVEDADGSRVRCHQESMVAMRTKRIEPDAFIIVNPDELDAEMTACGYPGHPSPTAANHDRTYDFRREHMQLFEAIQLQWPASDEVFDCSRYKYLSNWGERGREMVVFIDKFFPPAPVPKDREYMLEFADVRDAVSRLLGWKVDDSIQDLKRPWHYGIHTITGNSRMVVRVTHRDDALSLVRPLEGFEVMSLIGWPDTGWYKCPSYEVLVCVYVCICTSVCMCVVSFRPLFCFQTSDANMRCVCRWQGTPSLLLRLGR